MHLESPRLILREFADCEPATVHAFECRNREFLQPFEPIRNEEYFTLEHWQTAIKKEREKQGEWTDCRFYLFPKSDPTRAIGRIGCSGIIRGAFHACYIGFAMDKDERRKGLMHEALTTTIRFLFHDEHLHRIMANYMERNLASSAVLEKLGFVKEGVARDYLYIAGQWENHVLTSLTNENWTPPHP
jgi:[ribosomal protein S5]-alanine N-acetyltransferase